ncbi:MAG: hypothetical protein A2043_01965 [Candidatus Schekmanbacteria bacterium GWA2_38_9]|uniref:LPP20 lipoprotein n=1 Tax=Candidatus Schekmanbacteria bacterium RIFCSPLOWO2_12_FULL_38_15 TaxID=1817883 RepID=A0A1F7SG53_9BACT|nr:MAG: hypothetical protein A2043_01965 [Candidatus Schekmanbacteria bacterium GWA2_38_9]OGL49489.1 MAG: hypothetical protein A3H37_10315 [Candidatus Schekmanbacteria bacterium RIFCSPLOWO2_02_FULL_38_14]OGL52147.1 MAG: hypothetical protein A3G31_06935 [Candidatus Schekmanbacteria bacterium RIFCSPLOWO2_12_FULL_38_15]
MKKITLFLLISFAAVAIFLSFQKPCHSKDLVQNFKTGKINWTKGVIVAWGDGYAPNDVADKNLARELAKRVAILDARKNLIEIVKSVRLDSKLSIEDIAKSWDMAEENLKRASFVSKARTDFIADNRARATLELKIYGMLADTVYPFASEPEIKESEKERFPPFEGKELSAEKAKTDSLYSGIIIDARNLEAKPALFPKIFNEKDELIYNYSKVDYPYAVEQGMVRYTKDLKSARKDERVSPKPLVLRAVAVKGEEKTNIVINTDDSKKLMKEEKNSGFLKQGKVVIVVDK